KLIERRLPQDEGTETAVPAVWKKGSPFRGLSTFEFEHAPVFFGRTKAVSDVMRALRKQAADGRAFVLILGMSGGGKSSVARSGVLPLLTQPGVIEGVGLWQRAVFRPGDTPGDVFRGLAKALLQEYALPGLDPESKGPDELVQILRESPQAAVSLIKNALIQEGAKQLSEQVRESGRGDTKLVLLVDQMEEMFTQEGIVRKDRVAFIDVLDAMARSGRVWVVATLRSDFYPRLANYAKLVALKEGDGQYDLLPPTPAEIGQIIRLPTRAAGLRFEEDPATSERLDDMLRDAAAEHPEVLPLLEFTLEELYQRRTDKGLLTVEAYREIGGVEGSLAQRAEAVFQELPENVQAALPRVLNALISLEHNGHETIGRKRTPLTEIATAQGRALVDAFVSARLFVTELTDQGDAVITVAHEALLWHWPRVREWVDQNRENLRIRGRVAIATERWVNENKSPDLLLQSGKPVGEARSLQENDIDLSPDETEFIGASIAKAKRKKQLKGAVVAMLAVLAVVAGSAAIIANQQRNLAVEQAETAQEATDFLVGLFEVSDPSEARGNETKARDLLDDGAERIERELADQPAVRATLENTMGRAYTGLGLYNDAKPLLESALDTRRGLYGDKHVDVAQSQNQLGWNLALNAEYERAEQLYRNALASRRELLGEEHPEVADSMVGLALVLRDQGEYEEAEQLLRDSLDMRR
ncbi:MAG: tetratricopeptide repeat protein, partial [Gammaproteobacteria bacterium]